MIDGYEAATAAATDAASVQRIEIVGDRRRARDASFRSGVLAEAAVAGARVQDVARRHGICTSLIYRWRRGATPQAGKGSAVRLLPVRIAGPSAERSPASQPAGARRSGTIEIEFAGGVRVRVDGDVSLASLRRVVSALRG